LQKLYTLAAAKNFSEIFSNFQEKFGALKFVDLKFSEYTKIFFWNLDFFS
jgi:hypothetical protein